MNRPDCWEPCTLPGTDTCDCRLDVEGVYVNEEEEEGAVKGKGVGVETSPARECREGMLPDLAAATGPFTCDLYHPSR